MKTIWKFPFPVTDAFVLRLPSGAHLLSADVQAGTPCLWALVDTDALAVDRHFRLLGTGHRFDDSDRCQFVATFQMGEGRLVFHLFEKQL